MLATVTMVMFMILIFIIIIIAAPLGCHRCWGGLREARPSHCVEGKGERHQTRTGENGSGERSEKSERPHFCISLAPRFCVLRGHSSLAPRFCILPAFCDGRQRWTQRHRQGQSSPVGFSSSRWKPLDHVESP